MSAIDEHLATRRWAGLFDFSFMGLYEFPNSASLQALQSRSLEALVPGQIAYTLLLNDDGSVFNDATLWRMGGERCWLFTGRRGDYARFRRVARDRSGEFAVLALQGPASGTILARIAGAEVIRSLPYFRFVQKEETLIARLGYSGELGYELLVPAAHGPGLRRKLLEQGVPECSFEAANTLRIEAGYVLFDREIDGRANPSELGLERLAGRKFAVRKKLVGLEIFDRPARGGMPDAHATSECFSPTLGRRIGLGFAPPGAHGEVRLADGRGARIATLPFHDPERHNPRGNPLSL